MRAVTLLMAAALALVWIADFLGGEGGDPVWLRALKAGAVIAVFIVFVRATARRSNQKDGSDDGAAILVAFASQSGAAEGIAKRTAAALAAGGLHARLADLGALDAAEISRFDTALFIASTTGEGDPPDNAGAFAERDMRNPAALNGLRYAVLALGDRGYADFCGFGRRLDAWLAESGAAALFGRIDVNRGDERAISEWFARIAGLGAGKAETAPAFQKWRLAERRVLNPGSDNPPLFHIGLSPPGAIAPWRAGDIAVISPRNDPKEVERLLSALPLDPLAPVILYGERMPLREALARLELPARQGLAHLKSAQALADALPLLPLREYSLASLPQDGAAELVVREMRRPDGALGVGSGWLTRYAESGGEIAMRIRENRAFQGPPDDRPMILVGAGSGVAGLRAHLKERRAAGRRDNWLLFGERSIDKDYLYRDEIESWVKEGAIRRLDLGFMDENGAQVLVQDLLRKSADDVLAWIGNGAAVYVCGSRARVGDGVDAALRDIIGEAGVRTLLAAGNYRRDVY